MFGGGFDGKVVSGEGAGLILPGRRHSDGTGATQGHPKKARTGHHKAKTDRGTGPTFRSDHSLHTPSVFFAPKTLAQWIYEFLSFLRKWHGRDDNESTQVTPENTTCTVTASSVEDGDPDAVVQRPAVEIGAGSLEQESEVVVESMPERGELEVVSDRSVDCMGDASAGGMGEAVVDRSLWGPVASDSAGAAQSINTTNEQASAAEAAQHCAGVYTKAQRDFQFTGGKFGGVVIPPLHGCDPEESGSFGTPELLSEPEDEFENNPTSGSGSESVLCASSTTALLASEGYVLHSLTGGVSFAR